MNDEKILRYNKIIFVILQLFLIGLFLHKLFQPATGDEGFYIKEINSINENGFLNLWKSGTSYLFVSIIYIFTKLGLGVLVVSRLLSFISYYVILLVIYKFIPTNNRFLMMNQVSIMSIFYPGVVHGTSDYFMYVFIIFAYVLFLYGKDIKNKELFMVLSLGFSFWIRKTSIIYCTPLIFLIFIQYIHKKEFKKIIFIPIMLFIIILPQIPAILDSGNIKFENKSKYTGMNWGKFNYLTPIYRNRGSLISYKMVEMDQIKKYEELHGADSIPSGILERVKFDPKFELDNFCSHFPRIVQLFLLMGGGFFIVKLLRVINCKKLQSEKDLKLQNKKIYLYYLATVLIPLGGLLFLIIRYIEARWVVPIVISMIISTKLNNKERKIATYLIATFAFLSIIKTIL